MAARLLSLRPAQLRTYRHFWLSGMPASKFCSIGTHNSVFPLSCEEGEQTKMGIVVCRARAAKEREAMEQRARMEQERLMRNAQIRAADNMRRREEMLARQRQANMAKLVSQFDTACPLISCIDVVLLMQSATCVCRYSVAAVVRTGSTEGHNLRGVLVRGAEGDPGPTQLLPGGHCLPP